MYNFVFSDFKKPFSNPYKRKQFYFSKEIGLVLFYILLFLLPIFVNQPIYNTTLKNSTETQRANPISTSNPVQTPSTSSTSREAILQQVDQNHNLISDSLEAKIASSPQNEQVKVIISLKSSEQIPNNVLSLFKSFGGQIRYQWDRLGMFAGTMPISNVKAFAQANQNQKTAMGLIEQDRQMVPYALPEKLTNVEPYVWNNYNLLGDKNNAIAIFDTGVDASHPMLANYSATPTFTNNSIKVVGWYDATPDGNTTPIDMGGHGTHVAAIAAGNPYNDTAGSGYIKTTYDNNYNSTSTASGIGYPIYINVSRSGIITETFYWKRTGGTSNTIGAGLYLYGPSGIFLTSDTSNTVITSNSGSFSISYSVTSNFGLYELFPAFNYQDTNSNLDLVTYGNYPFSSTVSSATHSQFSGVAPDSKIVGVKVFDNLGNGLSSYLVNGINWVIANKNTYHITVGSMSLGFPCNSNPSVACTTGDNVASVENAVNALVNAGVVTFVAAGNDGSAGNNQIGTPGNLDSVITVGATDSYHSVTYYSSLGPGLNSNTTKPDITAPGGLDSQGAILSADSNNNDAEGTMDGIIPDFQPNDLTAMQGTSMATPHAAGIGLLLIQAMGGFNNWNYTLNNVYKVKQIMLMSTWSTNGTRGTKNIHEGYGEIQANAAIDVIKQPAYAITSIANSTIGNQRFGNKIWGRRVDLTAGTNYNFVLTMSKTLDADLYLYSANPDQYGQPVIEKLSKTNGLGAPEYMSFTPSATGAYYIYVKTWAGQGSFSLTSSSTSTSSTISITNPTSGSTISGSITVKVSASNSVGISSVQARFSGSVTWVNLTYVSKPKNDYEFTVDLTQFPDGSNNGMDVRVLDNSGKVTYQSVYYTITSAYTGTDTINLALQGVTENQINFWGSKTFTLSFTTSITPDQTEIFVNNLLYTTITNSSIVLTLNDGYYDVRAVAFKGTNIRSIGVVYLQVDTTPRPPVIVAPTMVYYPIGTSSELSWFVTDFNPSTYIIYKDGSKIANGAWLSQVPITVSLTGLSKGLYNYTLVAFDTTNLNTSSTIMVRAFQNTVITGPGNLSFVEGSAGKSIQWSITGDVLTNYTVYKDGTQVAFAAISGTSKTVTQDLTGISTGSYNFTIAVYNQYNLLVTNMVVVKVLASSQTLTPISSSSKITSSGLPGFEIYTLAVLLLIPLVQKKRNSKK